MAKEIILVAGPPFAGKTTYALGQLTSADIILDLDRVTGALTNRDGHDRAGGIHDIAAGAYDAALEKIAASDRDGTHFVIATMPCGDDREAFSERYDAEARLLMPTRDECQARLKADTSRDSALAEEFGRAIDIWFADFTPSEDDLIVPIRDSPKERRMSANLIDLGGFAPSQPVSAATPVRHMTNATAEIDTAADSRIVRYVFSDQSVARDNHTIATAGWQLANYNSNPVFLWAHDDTKPPIGKVVEIGARGQQLVGSVEYADAETYPFADTIYRLVKGRFLNAVSVRWLPLDWKFATGPDRQGGIDFLKQELLEISQCPVPCLPSALATARAAGIDTGPLFHWAERVLDGGGMIAVPRTEIEQLRKDARMPTPKRKPPAIATAEPPRRGFQRGLYTVQWLAQIVQGIVAMAQSSAAEEAREGDDSEVPALLIAEAQQLADILLKMTAEEVAELLATLPGEAGAADGDDDNLFWMMHAGRLVAAHSRSAPPSPARDFARAGKMFSAENEACIRSAIDCHEQGTELLRGLLAKAAPDQTPADTGTADATRDDDEAAMRAARIAEAKALKAAA